MYGNGARTGMAFTTAVHRPILQDRHRDIAACIVAAVGAPMLGNVVCRLVASALRTASATFSASAFVFLRINTFN